jgi:hypothetical protein
MPADAAGDDALS